MTDKHVLPQMREFVMSLLVVAAGERRASEKSFAITDNAALRYCLELSGQMPELLRGGSRDNPSFGGWLAAGPGAEGFFELCGALLDAVDQRLRGRHLTLMRALKDGPSSYDHAAFLALGQTLSHAAGVRGGTFPDLPECLRRVAAASPLQLQEALIANYLGNILQDYFEASQIRAEFPKLPADTEDTLRRQEAAALAECIFRSAGVPAPAHDVANVQQAFREVIERVRAAEKALDD